MKELNCLGDVCPLPLMRLQKEDAAIQAGESVLIITDHSCTCEGLRKYCAQHGYHAQVEEPVNGVWEVTISKS